MANHASASYLWKPEHEARVSPSTLKVQMPKSLVRKQEFLLTICFYKQEGLQENVVEPCNNYTFPVFFFKCSLEETNQGGFVLFFLLVY